MDATQHDQYKAAASSLQQLFLQSAQPSLLSWLHQWLPQQLQTGATPAVLDITM
jgi:hypothetical protein